MLYSFVCIILTIWVFEGIHQKNYLLLMFTGIAHYALSAASFFLGNSSNGCQYLFSLLSIFIILASLGVTVPIFRELKAKSSMTHAQPSG